MQYRCLAFLLSLTFCLTPVVFAQSDRIAVTDLGNCKDKNRVLLVFALGESDSAYIEQKKLWQGEDAGFAERQLVVIPVFAHGSKSGPASAAALAGNFGLDPGEFGVILLGKDGREAYQTSQPVSAATLYGLIDAMPMRQAEMKRQRSGRAQ